MWVADASSLGICELGKGIMRAKITLFLIDNCTAKSFWTKQTASILMEGLPKE